MINTFRSYIFAILIALPLLAKAESSQLTDIHVENTPTSSHIIMSLSEPTQYQVFTLDHPYRLVIDLEKTRSRVKLKSLTMSGIRSVRSGHPNDSILRLVFDIATPLKYKYFFDADKNQLNLDVTLAVNNIPEYALKAPAEKQSIAKVQTEKLPPKKLSEEVVRTATPTTPILSLPSRKQTIVVVIDPGHGGKDTGAVGERNIKEKDVVLAISKKLADMINQQPGMRAVLTRDSDYFVPLRDRLKLARKGKADLFVAIHADAYFNNGASGASVYALSKRGATSEAARWIAKRDNYSELGGVDLGELGDQSYMLRSVLIDLAQTATIADSLHLGTSILSSLDSVTKLHYSRVEQAPFVVLKSPDIPSVLVETGFISNSREELRLNDSRYQSKIALALFSGVRSYLKKYPPGI